MENLVIGHLPKAQPLAKLSREVEFYRLISMGEKDRDGGGIVDYFARKIKG